MCCLLETYTVLYVGSCELRLLMNVSSIFLHSSRARDKNSYNDDSLTHLPRQIQHLLTSSFPSRLNPLNNDARATARDEMGGDSRTLSRHGTKKARDVVVTVHHQH